MKKMTQNIRKNIKIKINKIYLLDQLADRLSLMLKASYPTFFPHLFIINYSLFTNTTNTDRVSN